MSDPDVVVRLLAAIDEREREYHRCAEELREAARAKVRLPHAEFLRATVGDVLRLCQSLRDIVAEWQRWQQIAHQLEVEEPGSDAQLSSTGIVAGLGAAVVVLARGYGIEDGETT